LPVPDDSHGAGSEEDGGAEAGGEEASGGRPDRRRWLFGLVASPGLNATWLGAEGLGSYRVEGLVAAGSGALPVQRLHGTPAGLSGRLLATGFAYTGSNRGPQLAKLENLMDGYDDIRRCGAASVDLCMVAEGKVNSYAERGLGIYDYAGGAIIAEEAGIRVQRGGGGGPTAAAATQAEAERLIAAICGRSSSDPVRARGQPGRSTARAQTGARPSRAPARAEVPPSQGSGSRGDSGPRSPAPAASGRACASRTAPVQAGPRLCKSDCGRSAALSITTAVNVTWITKHFFDFIYEA